jgi:hypothetical protein
MTFPHMPEHCPFVSVEWIEHRKRNVPARRKIRRVTAPLGRFLLKVQFVPYAVTVCEPVTALHLIVAPFETRTMVGDQWVMIPLTVVVTRAGARRPSAEALVAAIAVMTRKAVRTSDV